MTLVVEDLRLASRLLQVRLDHLLADVFFILTALQAQALNLTLLEVKHGLDFLIGPPGLILLFQAPAMRLNCPQLVRIVHSVEVFLCLLLLLAKLNLLSPELALRLLSLLLDAQLALLLHLVVDDLLIELFLLAH